MLHKQRTNILRARLNNARIEHEIKLLSYFEHDFTDDAWQLLADFIGEHASQGIEDDPEFIGEEAIPTILGYLGDLQYQRERLIEALAANGVPLPAEVRPTPDDLKPIP